MKYDGAPSSDLAALGHLPPLRQGKALFVAFSNNAAIIKQKAHYKSLPLPQRGKVADHRAVG